MARRHRRRRGRSTGVGDASPAPARTRFRPPPSTPPATATERTRHGQDRQHRSGRHHVPPLGWQHDAVDVDVHGTDAALRRRPRRVAARRRRRHRPRAARRPRSARRACTRSRPRVVDIAGNASAWVTHDRLGRHRRARPDTTVVPADWVTTTADGHVNVTGRRPTARRHHAHRVATSTTHDHRRRRRRRPGPGHGQRRRRPHSSRSAHHRPLGRILELEDPRASRSTPSPRPTRRRRRRLAAATPRSTSTSAAPTRTPASSTSSGSSTAATSAPPSAPRTSSPSPATASTRSRRASSTTPASPAPGPPHTIQLDATAPEQPHAGSPRPAGATPPTPSCSTAPTRCSGVASVELEAQSTAAPSTEHSARAASRRPRSPATARTRSRPASTTSRATSPAGAPSTIKIDNVTPTDDDGLSVRAGRQRPPDHAHRRPTPRSGVAGVEWKLDGGAVKTATTATILGAGPHTLKTRVQDNAGNWSDWRQPHGHRRPSAARDTDRADRHHRRPDHLADRAPYTVDRDRRRRHRRHGRRLRRVARRRRRDRAAAVRAPPFTVTTDGVHDDRDARHRQRRQRRPPGARRRSRSTRRAGRHDRDPGGLDEHARTVTLSATDATSGVDHDRVQARQRRPRRPRRAAARVVTLPGRRRRITISHRASRRRRPAPRLERPTPTRSTPWCRPTRAPRRRPAWQTSALSLPLTGTDAALRRRPRRVARRRRRRSSPARPRVVATEGTQTLETRVVDKAGNVSAWRPETIKIDRTKPVNTTPRPRLAPGARRTTRRPSPAPTRRPGVGMRGSSTSSTAGAVVDHARRLDHHRGRAHAPDARGRPRGQRLRLAHRHDRHRQDRADARRRLRRRRPGATPPADLHGHRRGRRSPACRR